jgi:phosphotransferase system enzyme I (PtsI)
MTELRVDSSAEPATAGAGGNGAPRTLTGVGLCPGRVIGRLHVVRNALADAGLRRIARESVEAELDRFRRGLVRSREQLVELRGRLTDEVGEEDARILDTHLALAKDSAFIADVETLIREEAFALESAVAKVVGDFDRIFRLVNSEELRRGAADLRDVGLRVLRNLEPPPETASDGAGAVSAEPVIVVASELSVIDMLDLTRGRVGGVVAEEASTATHAAVLARSLGVPTLIGVRGALDDLEDGLPALLDADAGELYVAEDPEALTGVGGGAGSASGELEPGSLKRTPTADGVELCLLPACGNASDVQRAVRWGATEIGLFRTELSFLLERTAPDTDQLVESYRGVCEAAEGRQVTFRLLSVDSSAPLSYVDREPEPNPALGVAGVRLLREHPELLRAQLGALLRLGAKYPLRIAIPFVDDLDQFAFVRDSLASERVELRKREVEVADDVELGVVLDTPAALLGLDTLCEHADFLIFHLDSLTQYVLAADRALPRFAEAFERLHPYLLRALHLGLQTVKRSGIEYAVTGGIAERAENVEHLVGLGFRRLCVGTHALGDLRAAIGDVRVEQAEAAVESSRRAPSARRERSPVAGYRHGLA